MTKQEILKYNYSNGGRNYVLLGNTKWIAFTKNIIERKLIPQFGPDFNLLIYWYKNTNDDNIDYICVPYSKIAHLLTEEHLTGKNTKRERWMFIIKDNLLCVHASTMFSLDVTPYLNRIEHYSKVLPSEKVQAEEGNVKYLMHKSIERNSTLVNKLKLKRQQCDPKLHCEICGFSFVEKYGKIGEGFIEAHHIIPLSSLNDATVTHESDLILICPNCHRMLHRINPVLSIQELKSMIGRVNGDNCISKKIL